MEANTIAEFVKTHEANKGLLATSYHIFILIVYMQKNLHKSSSLIVVNFYFDKKY